MQHDAARRRSGGVGGVGGGSGPRTRQAAAREVWRDWGAGVPERALAQALACAGVATRVRAAAVCRAWNAAARSPEAWAALDLSDADLPRFGVARALALAGRSLRIVRGCGVLGVEDAERVVASFAASRDLVVEAQLGVDARDAAGARRALALSRGAVRVALRATSAAAAALLDAFEADRAAWPAAVDVVTLVVDDCALAARFLWRCAKLPCPLGFVADPALHATPLTELHVHQMLDSLTRAVGDSARVCAVTLGDYGTGQMYASDVLNHLTYRSDDLHTLRLQCTRRFCAARALAGVVSRARSLRRLAVEGPGLRAEDALVVAYAMASRDTQLARVDLEIGDAEALRPPLAEAVAAAVRGGCVVRFSLTVHDARAAQRRLLAAAVQQSERPTRLSLRRRAAAAGPPPEWVHFDNGVGPE